MKLIVDFPLRKNTLHVLHNQLANIENESAAGLNSIVNTSFG
jgi:hypothetical protein